MGYNRAMGKGVDRGVHEPSGSRSTDLLSSGRRPVAGASRGPLPGSASAADAELEWGLGSRAFGALLDGGAAHRLPPDAAVSRARSWAQPGVRQVGRPAVPLLLGLQRSAGNRAVGQYILRQVPRRRGQPNLKTGIPALAKWIVEVLKDRALTRASRDAILMKVDASPSLADPDTGKRAVEKLYNYYLWHSGGRPFEVDVAAAIKSGALSPDIKSRLPRLFPGVASDIKRKKEVKAAVERYRAALRKRKSLSGTQMFHAWIVENWDWFIATKYVHKGRPPKDGLFFSEPTRAFDSVASLRRWLEQLRREFDRSARVWQRWMFGEGPGGGSVAEPVTGYQRTARYIALDANTRVRGKRPSTTDAFGRLKGHDFVALSEALTRKINADRYHTARGRGRHVKKIRWPKEEIWKQIHDHMRVHSVPYPGSR